MVRVEPLAILVGGDKLDPIPAELKVVVAIWVTLLTTEAEAIEKDGLEDLEKENLATKNITKAASTTITAIQAVIVV